MKDITYYFGDSPRNSENASVATKEVSMERAKIDDAAVEETRGKRKRGRVKIKISRKSSEGTVCDIIENSTDLVDKTPSPYPKPKRRQTASVDDTPKQSTSKAKDSDKKDSELQTDKCNETNVNSDSKNQLNGLTPKDTDDSVTNANTKQTDQSDTAKVENETKKREKKVSAKKEKEKLKQQTEKLIELADKKGYTKRKLLEEKEDEKIAKRLEKRKQMFTLNKTPEVFPQGDENTPKNTDSTNVKHPGSLLNYFSKATPEQIEKEKLMKSKFTVKAEIHAPKNLSTSSTPVSNKKKKESPKKRNKSSSKLKEEFDEICLIETETLVLSPKNEKLLKLPILQNKPKWSLKIQLQSNNNIKSMSDELDEDIYTPTASKKSQNENMKCSDKIPKILMPIKNKKDDINPSLNNNISKNKKEEKNNIKSDHEEKLKTEKIKTGVNKQLSGSTTSEQLHIKEDTNSKKEKVDDECQVIKENGLKRKSDEKLECIVENVISKKEVSDDDECQIVKENRLKRKSKEKLAPLFTKKLKPNPEVIAARRLFLQSDVQENDSTTENRKPMVVGPIILPFPKISHINQLSPDKNTTLKSCSFSLKKTENIDSFNLSQMKTLSKANDIPIILENIYECIKLDTEAALSEIETYYSDVHTLWKSISRLLKSPESPKRTPKTRRKISQKKNLKKANENLNNELLNSPWTDKYRPMSSAEVVGNEEAAIKLKSWLDTWKSSKNNEEYSSGDEFYTSDCSMSSNIENNHAAVLIGPHGSGKTACVYAVAQELGYKVLELNASSKRPGKKILKDFEEATKSHRVKKSNLKDVFVPVSKKMEETEKISQNSLILMEDVDLIFEEDEGFVSATYQLASNTKRPIVMTLRGTCSHLFKMAPQQFRINFQPVTGKKVLALFQLITLAETGCKLSENCIETLCQSGDLRKGLLQLQYLLLSGKERISSLSLSANNSSWKNMRTYIYKPAIKADKSKNKKKKRTTDDNVLDNLSNSLEHFTIISTLINIEDPSSHSHNLNFEPSISLVENTSSYSSLENTSLEIGNWLNEFISKSESRDLKKTNNQMSTNNSQLSIQKQVNIDVDTALSQIPSNTLDRRALAVDYLSSIRTICRAEESRNQLNSKRGNRFFHYLQGSKLSNMAAKSGNILSAACKMLQEKSTET